MPHVLTRIPVGSRRMAATMIGNTAEGIAIEVAERAANPALLPIVPNVSQVAVCGTLTVQRREMLARLPYTAGKLAMRHTLIGIATASAANEL